MSSPPSGRPRSRAVGYPPRFKRLFIETFGMVLMALGTALPITTGNFNYAIAVPFGLAIFQRPAANHIPRGASIIESLFRMWTDRRTGSGNRS